MREHEPSHWYAILSIAMKNALTLPTLCGIVILVALGFVVRRSLTPTETAPAGEVTNVPTSAVTPESSSGTPATTRDLRSTAFETSKKSAHYESNTPAHGMTLAAPPLNVVIDFNFDLALPSSISITSGGNEYGTGPTTIDANKLAMRRAFDPSALDGLYTVTYQACWPDKSCHDGSFQFAIDRTQAAAALDLRGQTAVNVHLKDIAFAPATIRIRKGTTVTWTNDDTVEHYVNTDAHPSHTYFPAQNSRALKAGETYTVAFQTPGAYPYHCSAHADAMRATILVE